MATPGRMAVRAARQTREILTAIEDLVAIVTELKAEIAELKPKKRGPKPKDLELENQSE